MLGLKELQRIGILSATIAILAFSGSPAKAAISFTSAGSCTGVAGTTDCSSAVGHIGVSVVGTLSINEVRAISFGNLALSTGAAAATGGATVTLNQSGALTTGGSGDTIVLLHGADATNGPGATGNAGYGQSPGHYKITDADTTNAGQVYISFADATTGAPLDCNGDTNFPNNNVHVIGPSTNYFTANAFTFTEDGDDVYGHFVSNAALPIDLTVGATLTTVAAQTYVPGKYVGTFNIIVSY